MRWSVLTVLVAMAGCLPISGRRVSYNNDLVSRGECTAVSWSDGPLVQSCEQETEDSEWECDCTNGNNHEPNRDFECRDALQSECGTSDDAFDGCIEHEVGLCVPGDGDAWDCACDGDDALASVPAATCTTALWTHCGRSCSTTGISCAPGTTLFSYVCQCEALDAERALGAAETCEDAFRVCRPGEGPCIRDEGFCDEVGGGYSCRCSDGTTGFRAYEDLEYDECYLALDEVCPA